VINTVFSFQRKDFRMAVDKMFIEMTGLVVCLFSACFDSMVHVYITEYQHTHGIHGVIYSLTCSFSIHVFLGPGAEWPHVGEPARVSFCSLSFFWRIVPFLLPISGMVM
jgi:hypothetical protein